MTDFAWLSISEASSLIRSKKISPVEYAEALIERINRHDGAINSFLF